MTIVIDASVIVAALVDTGRDGIWAESLIASETLVAPELAMVEATNILRRLELAKELSPGSLTSPKLFGFTQPGL